MFGGQRAFAVKGTSLSGPYKESVEPMSTLVTGGAGYIGSHMVRSLLDRGDRVVVLDDLSTGFRSAVPAEVDLHIGAVGDRELVREIIKIHEVSEIAHFAASCVVPDSVIWPAKYYGNNTIDAFALIDEAARGGVERFLFSSTAAVYAPSKEGMVAEDAPLAPMTAYGASKLMTERILTDVGTSAGMSTAILRYFNVAGADPAGRVGQSTLGATHLIKVCVEAAVGKREFVSIFGEDYPTHDGTGVRDFIHVADLVTAHIRVLEALRSEPGSLLLNCGYGQGYSVREVIRAAERVSGQPIALRHEARRPGDLAKVVADGTRLRQSLAWTPQYSSLDTILEHALAWEKLLVAKSQ
jgi:UDP-glucose 4-epimerase